MKLYLKQVLIAALVGTSILGSRAQTRDEYPFRDLEALATKISYLIYVENDYHRALELCNQKSTLKLVETWANRHDGADRYINKIMNCKNLIENCSDYDRNPLNLYFEARQIDELEGHQKTIEKIIEQGNLYRRLLVEYPSCKLAGFTCYLLAEHYVNYGIYGRRFETGLNNAELMVEFREIAVRLYNKIIDDYSHAVFPTNEKRSDGLYFSRMGIEIAPLAQMKIARLWDHRGLDPQRANIPRAGEEYQNVIDRFPGAIDTDSTLLALKAYLAMLDIYSDKYNYRSSLDFDKARNICQIMLSDFPNLRILKEWISIETHPAVYFRLAEIESDKEQAIGILKKIIYEFPDSFFYEDDGPTYYSDQALREMIRQMDDPNRSIEECRKIMNSDLPVRMRAFAQLRIALIYLEDLNDKSQALIEFRSIVAEFGDVPTGYMDTFGYRAEDYIKRLEGETKN